MLRCTVWCLANGLPFGFRPGTLAKSESYMHPGTFQRQGGEGILVFTFLWLEALGECCPNFDTLALFKRRENATQILIFMLWLGHQKEPKSHQNPPQIDNKSSKLVLGMTLGTPGLPLEASWAPLGAPTPKTIKKVTWWTPPPGRHFGLKFHTFW